MVQVQFFRICYYNPESTSAQFIAEAQWFAAHRAMVIVTENGLQIPASDTGQTILQYIKQYSPNTLLAWYILGSNDDNIGGQANAQGWATHVRSLPVNEENIYMHTALPITSSNRFAFKDQNTYLTTWMNYGGSGWQTEMSAEVNSALSGTGIANWIEDRNTQWYNNPKVTGGMDASFIDNYAPYHLDDVRVYGEVIFPAQYPAEYSLNGLGVTPQDTNWANARIAGLTYITAHKPTGKRIFVNGMRMASDTNRSYGGDQNLVDSIFGSADGFADEAGVFSGYLSAPTGNNSGSNGFLDLYNAFNRASAQGKYLMSINFTTSSSWSTDINLKRRVEIAQYFILYTTGVNVSIIYPESGYNTLPVYNNTPYYSWYDTDLGSPTQIAQHSTVTFGASSGDLYTRLFSGGYVAMILPISGVATDSYTLTLPSGNWTDVTTGIVRSGTITLLNGDAFIATGTSTGWSTNAVALLKMQASVLGLPQTSKLILTTLRATVLSGGSGLVQVGVRTKLSASVFTPIQPSPQGVDFDTQLVQLAQLGFDNVLMSVETNNPAIKLFLDNALKIPFPATVVFAGGDGLYTKPVYIYNSSDNTLIIAPTITGARANWIVYWDKAFYKIPPKTKVLTYLRAVFSG